MSLTPHVPSSRSPAMAQAGVASSKAAPKALHPMRMKGPEAPSGRPGNWLSGDGSAKVSFTFIVTPARHSPPANHTHRALSQQCRVDTTS